MVALHDNIVCIDYFIFLLLLFVCVCQRVGAVKYQEWMFNCYLKKYNAVMRNGAHFISPPLGNNAVSLQGFWINVGISVMKLQNDL
jgi:hypothetical protein